MVRERLEAGERPLPRFCAREIDAFLRCGVLAYGFARVWCQACGKDDVVPFSWKGRGFCPSCGARRMADTAAWLVDRVIPEQAPVRQWVLSLTEAINQLIGNGADRCKGRQMPCHYTVKEGNYYGMSSVIGTQISHATGAAMAARIKGDDIVVLGYMGDGATSANDFHCGMNFAAVYKSPCIMFCQNNQWAISVPLSKQSASETLAQKGKAYGMPYVRVDGNDVLAVYSVTKEAAARARAGDGPTFIEAVTYRRLGHSSSDDPTRYRDEAEVKLWEQRDPVDRFRTYLQKKGLWDDGKEAAFKDDIAQRVNDAIAAAEKEGPPEDETLVTDVYARVTEQQKEQLAEDLALERRGVNTGAFPL
ncbi:MAG: thiamine pyrophosphate-dependent enzyme [Planctomycetota bacterium]